MHAYLLVSPVEVSDDEVKKLIPTAKLMLHSKIKKIADTKELIKETNVVAQKNTVYVLSEFDKASPEAQNAFLKRLEEPQENITFVLSAANEDLVLPTIISRCEVVRVASKKVISNQGLEEAGKFAESDVSGRFSVVSKINKQEDAVEFLEKLIYSLHEDLVEKPERKQIIMVADKALNRIKRNANPTVQLTAFAIGF